MSVSYGGGLAEKRQHNFHFLNFDGMPDISHEIRFLYVLTLSNPIKYGARDILYLVRAPKNKFHIKEKVYKELVACSNSNCFTNIWSRTYSASMMCHCNAWDVSVAVVLSVRDKACVTVTDVCCYAGIIRSFKRKITRGKIRKYTSNMLLTISF